MWLTHAAQYSTVHSKSHLCGWRTRHSFCASTIADLRSASIWEKDTCVLPFLRVLFCCCDATLRFLLWVGTKAPLFKIRFTVATCNLDCCGELLDWYASFIAKSAFSTSGQMLSGIAFKSAMRRCCEKEQKVNFRNNHGICPPTIASLSTFIPLIRWFLWNYGGLTRLFHSRNCLQYIRPNVLGDFLQKCNKKVL